MLDLLLDGNPPSKVRKKFPSRGATLAKVIQIFVEMKEPYILELQKQLNLLQSQISALGEDINLRKNQVVELDSRVLDAKKRRETCRQSQGKSFQETNEVGIEFQVFLGKVV